MMWYDDRYTPLLQRADLHVVAQVVRRGLPNFYVDRLARVIAHRMLTRGQLLTTAEHGS
jgi:hypothetical protein